MLSIHVYVLQNGSCEGHPISSDNGLISQKLLLKSELYYPLHVCCLLMFEIWSLFSQPDLTLYNFVNYTVTFLTIFAGGRVSQRCDMFLWKVILVVGDVV